MMTISQPQINQILKIPATFGKYQRTIHRRVKILSSLSKMKLKKAGDNKEHEIKRVFVFLLYSNFAQQQNGDEEHLMISGFWNMSKHVLILLLIETKSSKTFGRY